MDTYYNHVQYQMFLDPLNLNNNSLVSLLYEYFHNCFSSLTDYTFAAGDGDLLNIRNINTVITSNFLLEIPFAAD
jgi:hypothetical protein